MNLSDIRAGLKVVLDGVDGVRGYDYMPGQIVTSSSGLTAVVVSLPANGNYISYLEASSGGQVQIRFDLRVFVQMVDLGSAQRRMDGLFSAGTGQDRSLFDAVRADNTLGGTAMDCAPLEATVSELATLNGVDYLAASLECLVLAQRT